MDVFRQWAIDLINQIVDSINSFQHIILNILGFDISDAGLVMTGIQSAALSLAGLFLAMEMISLISEFRFERIEDAIRFWQS